MKRMGNDTPAQPPAPAPQPPPNRDWVTTEFIRESPTPPPPPPPRREK